MAVEDLERSGGRRGRFGILPSLYRPTPGLYQGRREVASEMEGKPSCAAGRLLKYLVSFRVGRMERFRPRVDLEMAHEALERRSERRGILRLVDGPECARLLHEPAQL